MSVLGTDDFNRANAGTLGANWTETTGSAGFEIFSNAAANLGAGAAFVSYTNATAPANQYSKVTVTQIQASSDEGMGPAARIATGALTGYFIQPNTVEVKVYKGVNDTYTQLGSDAAAGAANDIFQIEATGTSITAKKNGSTIVGPITDSSIASGNFGLWYGTSAAAQAHRVDTWEGGDFAGGNSSSVSPSVSPSVSLSPSRSPSPSASVSPSVSLSPSPSSSVSPSVSRSPSPSSSVSSSASPSGGTVYIERTVIDYID